MRHSIVFFLLLFVKEIPLAKQQNSTFEVDYIFSFILMDLLLTRIIASCFFDL